MQSRIKILLVVNFKSKEDPFNVSGVEYHRIIMPFIHLAKNYPVELHQINEINPETTELKNFDLVVFSRVLSNHSNDEAVLKALQKARTPFIVDVDDYWHLSATHLLYAQWQSFNMTKRIELALKNAAAVLATTPHLAGMVRKLNKNVTVVTNAIDPGQPQFQRSITTAETVRLGWVGGLCHTDDIPLLQRGFERLYNDADTAGKYSVSLCGYSPQNFDIWAYYEYIFTAGQKRSNYKRIGGQDIRKYATLYNDLDICLVPLADTPFNRCKSELKLIEAGWFKKPCIVSQVYPYTLMGQHGKNLLFVQNNKIDWHKYMKKLIQSPTMRQDLGEALHQTVTENYSIEKASGKRWEVINRLMSHELASPISTVRPSS